MIERHLSDIERGNFRGHTLENGLIGICWVLMHINKYDRNIFEGNDIEDYLAELDDFIIECSNIDYDNKRFDLLHGSLGAVFYFSEKKNKTKKAADFFKKSIAFFEEYQNCSGGWPIFDDFGIIIEKENVYDLGLAHGNPSIMMLLGQLYGQNYSRRRIKKMVYKNLDWLSTCKNFNDYSIYPSRIEDNYKGSSILAWCYGDLSISLTLLSLSRKFNDNKIYYEAIKTVENCLGRINEVKNNPVHSICHGTAGVAFILRQIENTYKIDTKVATQIALQETLSKAYTSNPSFPYQNRTAKDEDGGYLYEDDVSFLDGLSGIGLILLSFASDVEPDWKKCLLI